MLAVSLAGCGDNAPAQGASQFIDVSAGTARTCAIKGDGTIWCWGTGAMTTPNSTGLAVPVEQVPITTADAPAQLVPTDSGGTPLADKYVAVSVGLLAECALSDHGDVVCFTAPNPGAKVYAGPWSAVSVGDTSLCAIAVDGDLKCWGYQLVLQPDNYFMAVEYAQDLGVGWHSVAVGGQTSCGTKTDGSAWCWSPDGAPSPSVSGLLSSVSPLEDGTVYGVRADHVLVMGDTPVDGANDWATLDGGSSHVCATKLDGTGYCWGNADLGRVGLDPPVTSSTPTLALPGHWRKISAGGTHSCGIQHDGSLWCWGADDTLGGFRTDLTTVPLARVTQITLGDCNACALAGGSLQC